MEVKNPKHTFQMNLDDPTSYSHISLVKLLQLNYYWLQNYQRLVKELWLTLSPSQNYISSSKC